MLVSLLQCQSAVADRSADRHPNDLATVIRTVAETVRAPYPL